MKLALLLTTLVSAPTLALASEPAPEYRDTALPIKRIDPPVQVAGTGEAKILVVGYLPSTCYRDPRTLVQSPSAHVHYVGALASKVVNRGCTQVIEDYEEQVSLGDLAPGEHVVIVQAAGGDYAVPFTVSR